MTLLRKPVAGLLGVLVIAGAIWGVRATHPDQPNEQAQHAAWILQTQRHADARYDFATSADGTAAQATVENVRFQADGESLELSRSGHWHAELALDHMGRGTQMRAIPPGAGQASGNEWAVDHQLVRETWISGPLGLEQVLDLARRPAGTGDLVVGLSVRGDLEPTLVGEAIELRDASGATRARYSEVYVEDASHAQVPARLEVAAAGIELRIDDSNAQYPLVIDPLVGVEQMHLFADNPGASDGFGAAVAFDGTTALVGAYLGDGILADTGAVYAFTRTGTTWSSATRIVASDGTAFATFGYSVALSGNTAVIGAPFASAGAVANAGAVYVFTRTGTAWTQRARLVASDASASDRFGASVAFDGTNLVVGAPSDQTSGGAQAGSAYVFTGSGASWTQVAHLLASDGAAGDGFGSAIAVSSGTIAVGAPTDDIGTVTDAGSAYLYTGAAAVWVETHLIATDRIADENLGSAVAIQTATLAVGASARAGSVGSVLTFDRSSTGVWTQGQRLAPPATTQALFGSSLSLDANRLAVGTSSASVPGFVEIFDRVGGTWSSTGHVVAADGSNGDRFGGTVAVVSDTVVAGASGDDTTTGGTDAGSAYVELLRSDNGDACTTGATCASGFCADGVCCNSACGGSTVDCQACSVAAGAAVDGMCTMASSGSICRAAVAGGCDVAETCNGTTGTCPSDVVAGAGTACRAVMGDCDLADSCDGTSPSCVDARVAAGTVCRASTGNVTCDPAETCSAASPSCPADTNTNGTACPDGVACNGNEVCMSGACAAGTAPTCDDSDACTADMCAEPAGCAHAHIAGCCNVAADCNDGDMCTADSCSGAGGTCSHTTIPGCVGFDAGPMPDAGHDAGHDAGGDGSVRADGGGSDANVDSGVAPAAASNCGCAAAGTSSGSAAAPLGLLGLVLVAVRRRRRR